MNFLQGHKFLIGNILLGTALVMLFFLGAIWPLLGNLTMVLWMLLAGAGFYLVTTDKERSSSNMPD